MRACLALLFASIILIAPSVRAAAQDPSGEAGRLAEGWAKLAKGDAAGAGAIAIQELGRNPNSVAALVLAIDADLARGGAPAGLTTYEGWLGARRLDSAHVLRRVARALLSEATDSSTPANVRLEALKALAADGDHHAANSLEQAALGNAFGELRALASIGHERAVKALLAQLAAMPGSKTAIIEALGESGSKLAITPLRDLLTDPNDLNRAAAADALATLKATEAVPQIRPLLQDPVFTVKLKAAGALLRLDDATGLPFLTQLTTSPHAAIRVTAAREMSSRPDAAWQALVRSLVNDPDPLVRLEAARLIAPFDQPLASSTLDGLARNDNIAIREAAAAAMLERTAADFVTLRTMMRSGDRLVRVKAAARILELTR